MWFALHKVSYNLYCAFMLFSVLLTVTWGSNFHMSKDSLLEVYLVSVLLVPLHWTNKPRTTKYYLSPVKFFIACSAGLLMSWHNSSKRKMFFSSVIYLWAMILWMHNANPDNIHKILLKKKKKKVRLPQKLRQYSRLNVSCKELSKVFLCLVSSIIHL